MASIQQSGRTRPSGMTPAEAQASIATMLANPVIAQAEKWGGGYNAFGGWSVWKVPGVPGWHIEDPQIEDQADKPDNPGIRDATSSALGQTIPISLGLRRLPGNVIQSTPLVPRLVGTHTYDVVVEIPVYEDDPETTGGGFTVSDGDDDRSAGGSVSVGGFKFTAGYNLNDGGAIDSETIGFRPNDGFGAIGTYVSGFVGGGVTIEQIYVDRYTEGGSELTLDPGSWFQIDFVGDVVSLVDGLAIYINGAYFTTIDSTVDELYHNGGVPSRTIYFKGAGIYPPIQPLVYPFAEGQTYTVTVGPPP